MFITGTPALKLEVQEWSDQADFCPGALLPFNLCPHQPSCNAAAGRNPLIPSELF